MSKQVTEDYVSFETAKLLKEKKFSWKCNTAYLEFEDGRVELRYEDKAFYQEQTKRRYCVPALLAPSLYNTMKWLREVHNQIIIIKYGNVGFVEESILQWWWELLNTKGELHACNIVDGNKSYEEACEDSILYVSKNLI